MEPETLRIVIITALAIVHICCTAAVYKIKSGAWACLYFFLAPLVFLLFLFIFGKINGVTKTNKK